MKTTLELVRKQIGLSQIELARNVGISIRAYQNYELGEREPKVSIAIKIAEVLNTDVPKLFGDREGTSELSKVDEKNHLNI